MKRNLLTHFLLAAAFLLLSISGTAQSTPNGNFESWVSGTYEIPTGYVQSSNPSTFFRCNTAFNCVKVADPYHGSYAIKMTTSGYDVDACFGYVLNANPYGNDPSTWVGGIPYTQKATGIRGYYKSAIPSGDSATIIAVFKAGGNVIGGDVFKLYGTHNTYTLFDHPFAIPLSSNPDSVIFAVSSSDVFNSVATDGSMIQLDSVSFTGVASQPALFNGDFESWQSKTIDKPNNWFLDFGDEGAGLSKTTDAHAGSFALQLKNLVGSDGSGLVSYPNLILSGHWDCSTGICNLKGGNPFTQMKDTLTFYYKYNPTVITDSAQVTIFFKKNGAIYDIAGADLKAAATYQYTEVPFQLGMAPDSVIIQFNSGLYSNTALIYAGADFKVDDVRFKSQSLSTGLQDLINASNTKVFPNPGNGIFVFTSSIKITDVEIMNLFGQKVYTGKTDNTQITVNLSALPKGTYIYTLRNKTKMTARGKIMIQ